MALSASLERCSRLFPEEEDQVSRGSYQVACSGPEEHPLTTFVKSPIVASPCCFLKRAVLSVMVVQTWNFKNWLHTQEALRQRYHIYPYSQERLAPGCLLNHLRLRVHVVLQQFSAGTWTALLTILPEPCGIWEMPQGCVSPSCPSQFHATWAACLVVTSHAYGLQHLAAERHPVSHQGKLLRMYYWAVTQGKAAVKASNPSAPSHAAKGRPAPPKGLGASGDKACAVCSVNGSAALQGSSLILTFAEHVRKT